MKFKTCVSIAESKPKKIKSELVKALKKSDYAEIRFDFLKSEQKERPKSRRQGLKLM
jgi:3-dehydroquinate dehydratase